MPNSMPRHPSSVVFAAVRTLAGAGSTVVAAVEGTAGSLPAEGSPAGNPVGSLPAEGSPGIVRILSADYNPESLNHLAVAAAVGLHSWGEGQLEGCSWLFPGCSTGLLRPLCDSVDVEIELSGFYSGELWCKNVVGMTVAPDDCR